MYPVARTAHLGLVTLGLAIASQPGTHTRGDGSLAGQLFAARLHAPSSRYDDYFRKYSKRYFGPGFAWRVFKAQAMAESGLDSTATSAVGARGIMQIMPSTFAILSARWGGVKSPEDAQTNIAAGIEHDAYLWGFFGQITPHPEHYRFMVGAYNAGEGTIQRAQRVARAAHADATSWLGVASVADQVPHWRYRETLGYVDRIARYYHRLQMLDAVPPLEMDLEQR
jgi:membrane-bound lytic murein transglycosylase MltF